MAAEQLANVTAMPVKSFFVTMLTRDISLQDAILDLLDNCVDGIQRSATKRTLTRAEPYRGFRADIRLSESEFSIKDNCGGIEWDLHDSAFRMGRIRRDFDEGKKTVGTYGIGMKRAMFKMGRDCFVTTHAADKSYRVHFTPAWMKDEKKWDVDTRSIQRSGDRGTLIRVAKLYETVGISLASRAFRDLLHEAIATHYAYIIQKGLEVSVNGERVELKTIRLLFDKDAMGATRGTKKSSIQPYIYQTEQDGVEVFLAVGFTSPIPAKDDVDAGLQNYREKYSSAEAGWTVICNDRTVLYCNKDALTGWGAAGVPQYHTQFVAISGIVVFTSDDASRLPMTTTKRGIDASHALYMLVRDRMIEGMKLFTQYTNRWKGRDRVAESRERFKKTAQLDLVQLRTHAAKLTMSKTKDGKRFMPTLPAPKKARVDRKIAFSRPAKRIAVVSDYLFGVPDQTPADVGSKCFDLIHEEARK